MKTNRKHVKIGTGDKIFYVLSGLILTVMLIAVLYPILFVLAASFSSGQAVSAGRVFLWPVDFSLEGYEIVFNNKDILLGFRNSIIYTVLGTFINLVMTMIAGYVLSRDDVPGHNQFMLLFTFTMFFSGGMIPNYMLLRNLHMLDTIWSMVIPGALGVYNMIIARTFIRTSIPGELLDAAQIDGCSDIRYFTTIVLPLSKAIMAVLVLFYGVGHWNSYFNPMLYLNTRELYPLPIILKEILIANQIDPSTVTDPELQMRIAQTADVIKYALIVVSTIPVMVIYPFVQKYFVKGVMIGSIKG
ncbi:MAG TPA: carbohydrate ABC transporter permease [Candidatus Eisenbergiella stercoravium]|nr:carbohydrate ABC transporter permease [Candidatus Eisenbergiella stercoravium]